MFTDIFDLIKLTLELVNQSISEEGSAVSKICLSYGKRWNSFRPMPPLPGPTKSHRLTGILFSL